MGSVAIVGAGKGGSALLEVLVKEPNIRLVGITDINPDAPGLTLARGHQVPVISTLEALLKKKPDIIINATNDAAVADLLAARKAHGTEVICGNSARFIWDLLEERRQAKQSLRVLLNETRELYRIGVALTSASKLEEVLNTLVLEACRTINAPSGSVALYNEQTDMLTLKASYGFSLEFSKATQWPRRSGGMTEHILSKRVPTVISDTEKVPFSDNVLLVKEGIKSIIAVPLYADEKAVGILYIDDFTPRDWTQNEIEFLTLLGIQAAFAIEKFRLFETITETKTYLKNVLDNSADIIMTTDNEGSIVEFNKGATRLLRYKKEEIIGTKAEALWVNPEERTAILQTLDEKGYVANYETQLKTKDGRIIDVSLTLAYIRNGDGVVHGTVGISKDITEKKRLERALQERNIELQELNERLEEKVIERTRELEQANKELERSNKLKSQFIATVSHELRTPLNSILGFSELLMDESYGTLSEKHKRYTGNIYNSGNHLLQLINNVLDIAKIESGKMELHYEVFPVHQALSEVETVVRRMYERKRQTLTITLDESVTLIKADRVKFKQVLYNLLSNAIKFTPEGGSIAISAKVLMEKDLSSFSLSGHFLTTNPNGNGCLMLSVQDTGIGISKENHERIFHEFEQVDSSFSRKYEGTGLGLALTKRLVELHGGEIWVESDEMRGSTFTIVMPMLNATSSEIQEEVEKVIHSVYTLEEPSTKERRGDSPLILIVEDDPSTAELLTLYLVQGGYRVAHAHEGTDAVEQVRALMPFAVLLDVMLPGKDGWQILQEIKSDPDLKDIPVVISSVNDNRDLGFALGASDYLVKPVDRPTLLGKLSTLSFSTKKGRRPVTILCIDDHDETLELLSSMLEPEGYSVLTANSGRKGIEKAIAFKPDLVILDLMMPEVDGFEVAQALKSHPATGYIPILILTAKDLTIEDRLKLAGKIDTFMTKSHFTKDDLLLHLRDLEATYPAKAGLIDEVSGLFDHCYFHIRLAQEVSRAGRYKGKLSVIMLDFDNFSEYIKAHGLHRANACVKKVADFLRKTMRGSDVIVRYGVDEFAVVLSNTLKDSAERVAKRLLSYIDSYPFFGEEVMPGGKLTASVCIISYPQDAASPEELVFKAHQLLKEAKKDGGRKIVIYGAQSKSTGG